MGTIWYRSGAVETSAGVAAAGALAYFYTGGTTTPLVVYSDAGQGTPTTTPVVADANGRWPDVFIPYVATYDVKVTTAAGTQLYYPRLIPNADPATVATGTISTSSSQLFQTGGMRFEIQDGSMTAPTGWVRCNRNSIGNATSGATERANADTSALFTFLWNIQGAGSNTFFPVVSGGTTTTKGASAAVDFAANKGIQLPDMRGASAVGVDAMGGTAAARFGFTSFAFGTSTLGGSLPGSNDSTLSIAHLAAHTHSTGTLTNAGEATHTHTGTTGVENLPHTHTQGTLVTGVQSADHTHSGTTIGTSVQHIHNFGIALAANVTGGASPGGAAAGSTNTNVESANHTHDFTSGIQSANHTHAITGSTGNPSTQHTHAFTTDAGSSHTHAISGATASAGSGTAFNNLPFATLGTWLIKL